jgi:hypothetical protein
MMLNLATAPAKLKFGTMFYGLKQSELISQLTEKFLDERPE